MARLDVADVVSPKHLVACILKGVLLAQAVVAVFMLELLALAIMAESGLTPGSAHPVGDTLAFWPRLAGLASVPGCLLGAVAAAHWDRVRRLVVLMSCAFASCVGVSAHSVACAAPTAPSADWWLLLLVGALSSFGYAFLALPPLAIRALLLEQIRRNLLSAEFEIRSQPRSHAHGSHGRPSGASGAGAGAGAI